MTAIGKKCLSRCSSPSISAKFTLRNDMLHIAILDDYQNVALEMADWSSLKGHAEIRVFNDHLSNSDEIVQRLLPFEVLCVMRERTPLPREILARLTKLRLIASTGPRDSSI